MKISFDFDQTLSRWDVQTFAKELIERGFDVWIVTSRLECSKTHEFDNQDIFQVVCRLSIPREKIVFTNFNGKETFFQNNQDFVFHLDDDPQELLFINSTTNVKVIDSDVITWKEDCLNRLNDFIWENK
jgi:hypothetical protein